MNAEFGGTTIQRTIRTLFDELALPVNMKDPNKTRDRFEKAMQCLLDDNIISSWGPEELYQQSLTQRPRYNWFDTWLDYQIEICAYPIPWEEAQILMEHLQEQRQQQRKMASQGKNKTQEHGTNTILDL